MHVVVKAAPRAALQALRQELLPGMAERRVPQVVAERDGLDELAVQSQQPPDVARDAPHQLHVQPATADIVILHQAEHLRFACIAVISGDVHDLVDVARERRARHRGRIVGVVLASEHALVGEAARMHSPAAQVLGYGLFHFGVKLQVCGLAHGASFPHVEMLRAYCIARAAYTGT